MKLASLKKGGRDGTLIVVSKDLKNACKVPNIANTMQELLENWENTAPALEEIYISLNNDDCKDSFKIEEEPLSSPLPRSHQWLDGSAYVNHVELVRKARGAQMPESFWTDPLMYQGASDSFTGPHDNITIESEEWGIDFESEVAIITDDVPMGIDAFETEKHIKLIMLVNDVSLRNLIPSELAKGFGFVHGKPASAFSPVAVTPDELDGSWHDSKLNLPLITYLNNEIFGQPNAATDMTFNFAQLISHAAKSRFLGAGTIIGSGTVSNLDRSKGSSCIAEKRMLEIIESGEAKTDFLKFGDEVQIEMKDSKGSSIFGEIKQKVVKYETL